MESASAKFLGRPKRALKRKVSEVSTKSQGRDISICQQYVIKGRCLGKYMYVPTKLVGGIPYAKVPSRCDWLLMMINNVKRQFDYKEGFKLTLAEIKSRIPSARAKEKSITPVDEEECAPPEELDLSDCSRSARSDEESGAVSDKEKQGKSALVPAKSELSVVINGHTLQVLGVKKVIHVKFTKENIRAMIDIIKSLQPGVRVSESHVSSSSQAGLQPAASQPEGGAIRLNQITKKFVLKYYDDTIAAEVKKDVPIERRTDESIADAISRTRTEAQLLWNNLDKSKAPRF
jgi:hypothetical protein